MRDILLFVFTAFLLQSCDYFTIRKDDVRVPVARVNDTFLYKDELKDVLSKGYSKQDSVLVTSNYINNWIKQQLLLSKAQLNLVDKSEKFEGLVEKYREDLYINSYKEAVVTEYLNTEVTDEDVVTFYKENKQNFKLNEDLVKFKFIKIGLDVLDKKEIIKLFKSKKKEDLESLKLKELSLKSQHLNDSVWIKYKDLISEIPILKSEDKKQLLKKDKFIQKEDSLSLYLVAVKQVLNRNEIAPISYITPTIKQMILHQRKLLLLRNIEETLIDDARKKQQFETY